MEQQLSALGRSREAALAYLIHGGFNSLPVHSREVGKGRVPRREETKNQPVLLILAVPMREQLPGSKRKQ